MDAAAADEHADAPVLALVGPTASGKSGVAMDLVRGAEAAGVRVEVVACDAFTVYRGMDVGTAKVPAAVRAAVPHHMVDVLDPDAACTAEWFQGAARHAIAQVRARGAVPLLVGGSGLYFRAVVDPLEFPPTDPDVRAAVVARLDAADPFAAHRDLLARDPEAAGRMDPGNTRRAVRALEVIELTGRPFSSFRTAWDIDGPGVFPGLVAVGLDLAPDALGERVAARTEAMLADGLVAEARTLRARFGGALAPTVTAAIGYAEAFAHLDGELAAGDLAERIGTRTRRYGARQRRWFRADPRVRWLDPPAAGDALLAAIAP